MAPNSSVAELMTRLRLGDQEAATQIFQTFSKRLIALARSRLHGLIRVKTDPEDVMASVFKSFFRKNAEEPFELTDWDSLWALLTLITLRKCGHQTRHFRAACRDVLREAGPLPNGDDSHASWQAIAHEPTPDEAAQLTDTVEQLMRELDERDRSILSLSLQGCTIPEIAKEIGRTERTIYRALERIHARLEQLNDDDPAG